MVRPTTTVLLALAATIPLTTAWPNLRRAPGVVSTISDGQPQAPTSTAAAVSTIADGQPQAPTSTVKPVSVISDGQPQAPQSSATAVSTISDGQPQAPGPSAAAKKYKYVFAISADGLHSSDVGKYVALRPKSTIASLLATGYEYSDAYTSAPSDSFPGTLAQYTGAGPATHGVWYDDTWDRSWFAPGSNCSGPPGANVLYDESIDYNDTMLFSGGIDPANLPMALVKGVCTSMYPHMRVRVNTVFEVARAAGLQTVYTDKHPAYDIVRGPSGKGLSEGYFPEMAALPDTLAPTIAYDQLHVNAWLDWIDGITPVNASITSGGSQISGPPAIFGGNFQSVSVAQKTLEYNNDSSISTGILKALDFVDSSLGQIVAKLKAKGYYEDTLIIVASKHGQSPIDPKLWNEVDPNALLNATSKPVAYLTTDDVGLMFLNHSSDTAAVVGDLNSKKAALQIDELIYGSALITQGFGDPTKDPAVPDIIIRPNLGTCYYIGTKKTAEHGGLSDDDRKVACFVSNPSLKKTVYSSQVSTKQVAPTILKALGLNPYALQGVVAEGTKVLPGF